MSRSASSTSSLRKRELSPHDVPDVALETRALVLELSDHPDARVKQLALEISGNLSTIIRLCAEASEVSELAPRDLERAELC